MEQRVAVLHEGNALLVPATADAVECLDHCNARKSTCLGSCVEGGCQLECHGAYEHCVEECPGAHWSAVQSTVQP
ncbi:MAG TPA: hypothetical protein VMW17_25015 [Candidatus Binatia bacterium]|nr:hypothetical protein [Candidatus Binatia bacterium]